MNKLKLSLQGKEMLSKEQMKKISGGYGTCGASVPYLPDFFGSCLAGGWAVDCGTGPYSVMGISYSQAMCLTQGVSGAHWCCDHCDEASWRCED